MIPRLPDKVEFGKSQLPGIFQPGKHQDWLKLTEEIGISAKSADGKIINTFEELDSEYVKAFKKVKDGKVWCVGKSH